LSASLYKLVEVAGISYYVANLLSAPAQAHLRSLPRPSLAALQPPAALPALRFPPAEIKKPRLGWRASINWWRWWESPTTSQTSCLLLRRPTSARFRGHPWPLFSHRLRSLRFDSRLQKLKKPAPFGAGLF